jgi:RimJ/RimL family protein N-acetyltransferase
MSDCEKTMQNEGKGPVIQIRKATRIFGQTINFRDATVQDAEFILSLRTDEKKSKYLSQTSEKLERQIEWLEYYAKNDNQAYFIIEDKFGANVGTVRLYDPIAFGFCWGSWIVKNGAGSFAAIESALMVYSFALFHLGFKTSYFDVRRENERVWRFHEKFGAVRVSESDEDFHYTISNIAIKNSLIRYKKYLKEGVSVEY